MTARCAHRDATGVLEVGNHIDELGTLLAELLEFLLKQVAANPLLIHLYGVYLGLGSRERLQGAQVAISNKVRLDADTLAACPELKLILVSATGTNRVGLALTAAAKKGDVIDVEFDSVCVHSDTPGALAIGEALRAALVAAEIRIAPPTIHG